MGIKRTKHAVFDHRYYLVWTPKHRKHLLVGEVAQYPKEVLQQIADEYGFWADRMEMMEDHMHVFLEVSPRYSPAHVVQIMKGISAREVFQRVSSSQETAPGR